MPRPGSCKVCESPARYEVDKDLAAGYSIRDTAGRHGFSKTSILRHKSHLATTLATIEEAHQEQIAENGRRSARNILDELAECFEDVWRLRQIVRRQLEAMEGGEAFDPVPLRILCDTIAQARATCQVAVNVNHLALEGERLRMEQEEAAASQEEQLAELFARTLEPTWAEDVCEWLTGIGVAEEVALQVSRQAHPLLAKIVSRFNEDAS